MLFQNKSKGIFIPGLKTGLLFLLLITFPLSLFASITITRTSSDNFYIDAGNTFFGQYVSYQIFNGSTGTAYSDIWVEITNFTGGVVSLATNKTNLHNLVDLDPGQTKTAVLCCSGKWRYNLSISLSFPGGRYNKCAYINCPGS